MNIRVVGEKIETILPPKQEPLKWLDMTAWDQASVPERKWAIRDRVPLRQAGLFSGEGGTGKSIIELMKDVAHVAGKDWLGSMPEPGPAFYLVPRTTSKRFISALRQLPTITASRSSR